MEAHGQGIDDLDLLDARLQRLGPGPLVALEAKLHVLGGDRVAVVELEPAAELELVDPPVRAFLPRLRQARAHLLPRQRAKQRIVDRIEQPERGDLGRGGGRVEPARSERDVPADDRLSGRCWLPGNPVGHSQDQHSGREQQHDATRRWLHLPHRVPERFQVRYDGSMRSRRRRSPGHTSVPLLPRGRAAAMTWAYAVSMISLGTGISSPPPDCARTWIAQDASR